MKHVFVWLCMLVVIVSCENKSNEFKDKVLVDATVENPAFGTLECVDLQDLTFLHNQKMIPNVKGQFRDTLDITHKGIYLLTFMNKSMLVYMEPGKKLNFKTTSKDFNSALTFSGDFYKENTFLNRTNKKLKDTISFFTKDMYKKSDTEAIAAYHKSMKAIDAILAIDSKDIKPEIVDFVKISVEHELQNKFVQFPTLHIVQTKNPKYVPSQEMLTFIDNIRKSKINDAALKNNPYYRKTILTRYTSDFQNELKNNAQYEGNKSSPFFVMKKILDKQALTDYQKDVMLATFSTQFDYKKENPNLKLVQDSVNVYIKTPEIKKELQELYYSLKGVDVNTNIANLEVLNQKFKPTNLQTLQGTYSVLFFWTGFSMATKLDMDAVSNMKKKYSTITFAMISMDKKHQWKPFLDKYKLYDQQYVVPNGTKSDIAKKLHIGNELPYMIILDKKSNVLAVDDGLLNNPKTTAILDSISKL